MEIYYNEPEGKYGFYEFIKFPDKSIKVKIDSSVQGQSVKLIGSLTSNDDIVKILLIKDALKDYDVKRVDLFINYMMYQQDDRKFNTGESFGLKVICKLLNTADFDKVFIYSPHSDKVEFIDNLVISNNYNFIEGAFFILGLTSKTTCWVIPDSGAFKSQFDMASGFADEIITCSKSRDHITGEIVNIVPKVKEGKEKLTHVIVDDICLGGKTFIGIAEQLKQQGVEDIVLVVTHGVFNKGIDHLQSYFTDIVTSNSICQLRSSKKLTILKV